MIRISNREQLIKNGMTSACKEARRIAIGALEAALSSVDPKILVRKSIEVDKHNLRIQDTTLNVDPRGRIFVIGGGKASGAMAEEIWSLLGDRISEGLVNVLRGTSGRFSTGKIVLNEARHPIPDEGGVRGASRMLEILEGIEERDIVIFLISGGGSALMPMPREGITLEEKQETTTALLKCGANIDEINVVRKHISQIKGGRMAVRAYPSTLLSLVISDVVGDPLTSIASGPTVPDPSTYREAISILRQYGIWDSCPEPVRRCLLDGVAGKIPESPKPGDRRLSRVYNFILGNSRVALNAAREKTEQEKCTALIVSSFVEGEARHAGTFIAGIAKEIHSSGFPIAKPCAVLFGGETTVTVSGKGRGGRNQELVLSSAFRMKDLGGTVLASIGSDGVDGVTDVAGALSDGHTLERAVNLGFDPAMSLANNDAYPIFDAIGDTIRTGPTGTSVNDLTILVAL